MFNQFEIEELVNSENSIEVIQNRKGNENNGGLNENQESF